MNRNQKNFDNFADAKIQAKALSMTYEGRFFVVAIGDKYKVCYDDCKVRDGVDESEILFESISDCNCGTMEYRDCVKIATEDILEMC